MAASTLNFDAPTETEAAAPLERPNKLFMHNEDTLNDSAKHKQQQQQTKYATTSASAAISPSTSPSSVASATSPSFLPEMPQWKKDLIQRRKSNVARTAAAATAITPTSSSTTTTTVAAAAAAAIPASATITTGESRSTNDQVADGFPVPPTNEATLRSTTVSKTENTSTTTQANITKVNKIETSQQQNATEIITTAEEEQQQYLPKTAKSNTAKMPVTNTQTTATTIHPTTTDDNKSGNTSNIFATKSTTSSILTPTKEKAEKFIGGHYTPQVNTKQHENDRIDPVDQKQQQNELQLSPIKLATEVEAATEIAETATAPIPKQRSLFLTSTTSLKSHTKEQQQYDTLSSTPHSFKIATLQESASSSNSSSSGSGNNTTTTKESIVSEQFSSSNNNTSTLTNQQETTTVITKATITRLTSSSSMQREHEHEHEHEHEREREHSTNNDDCNIVEVSDMHEAETTRKPPKQINIKNGTYSSTQQQRNVVIQSTTTPTGANPPQVQQQFQSNLKYESERTLINNSGASVLTPDSEKTASPIPIVCAKISSKLQNNQFIKNQQAACSSASQKYIKYKSYSAQENTTHTAASASGSTLTGSPTKTSANTANTCAIKKKMVAVQEMKKTTQNASHHHQQQQIIGATTCARNGRNPQQNLVEKTDFDPSEDLSYGPGIVSKLRCRYLSLALRQSMENKRHCMDNLRRATSLNNLLDRDEANDDEDEEEEDADEEKADVELRLNTDNIAPQENDVKIKSGILKHTNDTYNQESLVGKKTATFQKYANNNSNGNINGTSRMSQSQNGGNATTVGVSGTETNNRSRHLKRGNDSLKRARSVEALLCEKTPWNFALNRTSLEVSSAKQTTPTCVTIEDKINNARERLILGTDSMPPKRLTSIIDDTERPPPDLVKQTLKMFEATANRRPRPTRANSKGEVANKVASYKSIIQENKPAIVFPKPTSPTKKLVTQPKVSTKPMAAADLISSPVGRKATATVTGTINTSATEQQIQNSPQTPKFKTGNNTEQNTNVNVNTSSGLSDNSPDIIPRQKLLAERGEASNVVDSPVTALTKKLEKLCIVTDKQTKQSSSAANYNVTTKESQAKQQQQLQQQPSKLAAEPNTNEVVGQSNDSNNSNNSNNSNKFVGGDAAAIIDDKNDRTSVAVAEDRETAQTGTVATSSDHSDDEYGLTKRITKSALDNIAKAGTTQQFKFAGQSKTTTSTTTTNITNGVNSQIVSSNEPHPNPEIPTSVLNAAPGKQIGIIRPLLTTTTNTATTQQATGSTGATITNNQQHMETLRQHSSYTTSNTSHQPLTSREIEKNRINEMKKSASIDATIAGHSSAAACAATSLDTVINTNTGKAMSGSTANASGFNELDAVISSSNSPLWALRKKRQPAAAAAENTSMVFNFSNRKEVPDYIENDGVIIRRKRELPKPNESGFVLLGDLSLETSTDSDYDEFSLGPPSPCDVEFENANIVIDGKSSIRKKPKETTHRVQFNDTLTSTFEYPSEASLILDDDSYDDDYIRDDLINTYDNLSLDDTIDSPTHRHHHVAVDEIIPLPTQHAAAATSTATTSNTSTKNILGNLPLGSAPLGFYTPMKAPIDNIFQLGVTRAPNGNGHAHNATSNTTTTTTTNGSSKINGNSLGSIVGINGTIDDSEEPESLQFLKPANDDLTIAYSEGTQKTDLLY